VYYSREGIQRQIKLGKRELTLIRDLPYSLAECSSAAAGFPESLA
jgi:hypothetical protein